MTAAGLSAGDVMATPVVTVHPGAGLPLITRLFAEHAISALPVVDGWDRLVGIVTEHDLVHKAWRPSPDHTVRLLMSSPVATVEPTERLAAVAQRMHERHVKRLPVVESGRLLGILSRGDLLRAYLYDELTREELLLRVLGVPPVIVPHAGGTGADLDAVEEPGRGGDLDILVGLIQERLPHLP